MKKTFPFQVAGKAPARVIDAIKHDLRKYVQRELRKAPPAGFGGWEFHCRVGPTPDAAETVDLPDLSAAVDRVAAAEASHVWVEIVAQPAKPTGTPAAEEPGATPA